MNNIIIKTIFLCTLIISCLAVSPDCIWASPDGNRKQEKSDKLLERIDFGNSYIIGQSIKSGAVYLLQRKKSEINSMLEYRQDYRDEILQDFFIKEVHNAGKDKDAGEGKQTGEQ